jgi:hypothetical protein
VGIFGKGFLREFESYLMGYFIGIICLLLEIDKVKQEYN